jgi:putative membrane protein
VNARDVFTPEERKAVEGAIAAAEAKTAAEIVPVVATSSGSYSRAEDILGVWCGVLGFLALGLSHVERQIDLFEGLLVFFLGLGLGCGLLARFDPLKRLLTGRADRERKAVEAAHRIFFSQRIGRTAGRTGVLLYLSLFERVAVVLADERGAEALGSRGADGLRDLLVEGMKRGKPEEALVGAIRRAGERLAARLPREAGDRNELADRLVLIG